MASTLDPVRDLAHVEAILVDWARAMTPTPTVGRGRPRILPATLLWAGVLVGVLRGVTSQVGIWRTILSFGWWQASTVPVTDEAVYRRLGDADPSELATLFTEITAYLVERVTPWQQTELARFATDVVVLDETTLDPVARLLPTLRPIPRGDDRLLPGKLAGVFDVRRQLWREVQYLPHPRQNEKVAARSLVATLTPGTLVLADLGYFGFAWFDDLIDAGHHWVSRLRAKTSIRVVHVHYEAGETRDAVVQLGAYRADRSKHLVRLVEFRHEATLVRYVTSVLDPALLPLDELARLYARRWDIELAVKLVKRELGVHLLWSAKTAVILHQVWGVLVIAQILQALRGELASRAAVDLFAVSIPILIQTLPMVVAQHPDPMEVLVQHGRRLGVIRPSRRRQISAPLIPPEAIIPLPPTIPRTCVPRYAGRRCSSPPSRPQN